MRVIARKPNRIKIFAISLAGMLAIAVFIFDGQQRVEASASGPSPRFTGAPGEANCTACHTTFPVNDGTGFVQISGIPHDYYPGQQVTVSVTTSLVGAVYWGFEMTAIDHAGRQAGVFTFPLQNPPIMQLKSSTVDGNPRQYIEHTSDGLFTDNVFNSNTWIFTWTAPAQRVGKVGFYAAGNGANGVGGPTGDHIYTTSTASLSGSAIANFDGDFTSDIATYNPRTGVWNSYSIQTGASQSLTLGSPGSRIVPGDYDKDGTTDHAVFGPTGIWSIQRSTLGYIEIQLGTGSDIPVPGDYDGDRETDPAVFRPATGEWILRRSTDGMITVTLGQSGDKPVQGDYDADGRTDVGVYRPSNGTWYLERSSLGPIAIQYGAAVDRPVPADYDGDGTTDIAFFHPATGTWNLQRSSAGPITVQLGNSNSISAPADYDGDGLADVAVYNPFEQKRKGVWHILRSSDSSTYNLALGSQRDIPVPSGYLAQ
ncbi:MAG: choice-of-anchor V domain-containing protein [Pyrinomonadaceae bacterium]